MRYRPYAAKPRVFLVKLKYIDIKKN